jgi:anti-anti-sigma factor
MELSIRTQDQIAIVDIAGKVLGIPTDKKEFLPRVEGLVDDGIQSLVLNLEQTRYVSSRGLSMFLKAYKMLADAGGNMIIIDGESVIPLAIFGDIIRSFQTEADGIDFLKNPPKDDE